MCALLISHISKSLRANTSQIQDQNNFEQKKKLKKKIIIFYKISVIKY